MGETIPMPEMLWSCQGFNGACAEEVSYPAHMLAWYPPGSRSTPATTPKGTASGYATHAPNPSTSSQTQRRVAHLHPQNASTRTPQRTGRTAPMNCDNCGTQGWLSLRWFTWRHIRQWLCPPCWDQAETATETTERL